MTSRHPVRLAEIGVVLLVAVVATAFFLDVYSYSPAARLLPVIFLYVIAGLLILKLLSVLRQVAGTSTRQASARHPSSPPPIGATLAAAEGAATKSLAGRQLILRTAAVIGSVLAYLALIYVIGMFYAIPVFIFLFARLLGGIQWWWSLVAALATWTITYLLFVQLLGLPHLPGILWV